MSRKALFRGQPARSKAAPKVRLQLELLEDRNLLSGLTLLPLGQVSDPNPLVAPPPSPPPLNVVFADSEVEPQIAVDPTNTKHAVAIWQQDRYARVGGARALVVSVTTNANDGAGAIWSPPTALPGFDATASG